LILKLCFYFEFILSQLDLSPCFQEYQDLESDPCWIEMQVHKANRAEFYGLEEEIEHTPESSLIKSKGKTLLTRKLKLLPVYLNRFSLSFNSQQELNY
jgi:hypothetical protein